MRRLWSLFNSVAGKRGFSNGYPLRSLSYRRLNVASAKFLERDFDKEEIGHAQTE